MQVGKNVAMWLSRLGIGLILGYSFAVSIFYSWFAQIHVHVQGLPFPIFIGEMLLFVSIVIVGMLFTKVALFKGRVGILWALYIGWVLVKAFINYHADGPLTCRNAALFYYPFFAVVSYVFFQKARIPNGVWMVLGVGIMGLMFFKEMILWYWWSYFILSCLTVHKFKSNKGRWIGFLFLVIVLFLGREYIYKGPRAHFVSVLCAVLFLASYMSILLIKNRKFLKLGVLFVIIGVFIGSYKTFADRNAVSSVVSIHEMIKSYQAMDKKYQEARKTYVPLKLEAQLYCPKKYVSIPVSLKNVIACNIRQGRPLDLDEVNIVFRFFVWRDMWRELVEKKAWWGFSFGHPQRSVSLEALDWAESEWKRDGWITPHNSFFHIIYRSGILGVFFIGAMVFTLCRLTRDFFDKHSFEGGLLVAILVYWLVLSNFFVILEFPYNAIVFWSFVGVALAYRDELMLNVEKS